MTKKSIARTHLEVLVSETLRDVGGFGEVVSDKVARLVVSTIFESDNVETVQNYLNERIEHSLPDRSK